jgi:hypothetical protein
MTYRQQRYLAVAVAVVLAGIGVLQVADPSDFGLTPVALRWLGVLSAMLGVLAGYLPSVRGRGTDPEFLADRVWELSPDDREQLTFELERRALIREIDDERNEP